MGFIIVTHHVDYYTNLLFFEETVPTQDVWFYEHPLPQDRQKLKNPCYTKTKPLQYEEFQPLIKWWNNREENNRAWKVDIKTIIENNFDLDIKNPNKIKKGKIRMSKEILDDLIQIENKILEHLNNLNHEISKGFHNEK